MPEIYRVTVTGFKNIETEHFSHEDIEVCMAEYHKTRRAKNTGHTTVKLYRGETLLRSVGVPGNRKTRGGYRDRYPMYT